MRSREGEKAKNQYFEGLGTPADRMRHEAQSAFHRSLSPWLAPARRISSYWGVAGFGCAPAVERRMARKRPVRNKTPGKRSGFPAPLVKEVAHPRTHHGKAKPIRSRNDIRIAHRPARLNHRRSARLRRFLDPV